MLVDSDQTVASHAAHASTERERWSETKITLTANPTKTDRPTDRPTGRPTDRPTEGGRCDDGWVSSHTHLFNILFSGLR
jgi:hypothetical protein